MNSNDPRDEAILALVDAIRQTNANRDALELANRVEVIIGSITALKGFAAAAVEARAEHERLKDIESAYEWIKKHMPARVSNFGGSDGVFGWTGTDADGNRVTWKVEPARASGEATKADSKQLADTMTAFSELAPSLTAAAEKRFAADPFAPTFGLLPGEDAITIELRPRPGSVQYLINVTGPNSSAVKFEGGVPKMVHVSQVVESSVPPTPPLGAKPGYWLSAVGMKQPVWIETPPQPRMPARASPEG